MKCKEVRGLLLTDYSDGQMKQRQKIALERHLTGCPECKEFSLEAKKIAADLFTDIERVEPPDFIWHRVKEAIVSEQLSGPRHAAVFLEKLRSLIFMPKPAFILATALTLALIFGVTLKMMLNREYPLRGNSSEYSELLDNLTGPGTDISMASESDLGTSIETYFM